MASKWRQMTVRQLQDELRARGLRTTGRKDELLQRLLAMTGMDVSSTSTKRKLADMGGDQRVDISYPHLVSKKSKDEPSRKIEELFQRYADPDDPDVMSDDGLMAFCEDLSVDPADPVMLVIAFHMGAKNMSSISKKDVAQLFEKLRCGSINELRDKLGFLRQDLHNDKFPKIYTFAYTFSLEEGQKSLAMDVALELWPMLLKDKFSLLPQWIEFAKAQNRKAVSRDTWCQLWEFAKQNSSDLSKYDEEGAWPVMIDDFVAWMKEKEKNKEDTKESS